MSFNESNASDVVKRGIDGVLGPKGRKKRRVKYKIKIDNTLRGAHGETDYEKKTIRINRKRHKTVKLHKRPYPEMLDTRVHEINHVKHPKMTEKDIRKKTRRDIKRMNKKQKAKVYSKQTIYKNESIERR